ASLVAEREEARDVRLGVVEVAVGRRDSAVEPVVEELKLRLHRLRVDERARAVQLERPPELGDRALESLRPLLHPDRGADRALSAAREKERERPVVARAVLDVVDQPRPGLGRSLEDRRRVLLADRARVAERGVEVSEQSVLEERRREDPLEDAARLLVVR